jgi:superkiller protein 3
MSRFKGGKTTDIADEANSLYAEGRFTELEARARDVVQREPENADAWFWLGLALTDLERPEDALDAYERVRELAPAMIGAPMNAADLLMELGRHAEADALLERVMRDNPDRRSPLPLRVRSLIGMARNDDAARVAEAALRVEPEPEGMASWASELNSMGIELAKAGLSGVAASVLLRSAALEPNVAAYDNLGIVYGHMDRPLDSLLAFLHAVDQRADSARVYYNLARVLSTLEPAVAACRKAIELDPEYPDVRIILARLLDRLGRPEEAEEQFREAVARYNTAEARAILADFLYDQDRHDEAESEALAALDMDSSDALALRVVGDCHAVRGEYPRARTYYLDAAEKSPQWWLARWYVARIDAILHDKPALVESLEAALQIDCDETIEAFENDEVMEPYHNDISIRALLQSASLMGPE